MTKLTDESARFVKPFLFTFFLTLPALAQAASKTPALRSCSRPSPHSRKQTDIVWTIVAASLRFLHAGWFRDGGNRITRAKNAGNIMMKNLMDFCMGGLAFWAVGFGPHVWSQHGFTGWSNFFSISIIPPSTASGDSPSGCSRSCSRLRLRRSSRALWRNGPSSAVI